MYGEWQGLKEQWILSHKDIKKVEGTTARMTSGLPSQAALRKEQIRHSLASLQKPFIGT